MKRVLSLCICFALVAAPALYAVAEDSAEVVTQTIVSEPISVSVLAPAESPKAVGSTDGFAGEVLRLVNAERAKVGLKPLSGGYVALNEAAAIRAQEQATLYGHTRPNKTPWNTVLDQKNVSRVGAAENVAYGQTSPAYVMSSWMNSKDGHRESILTPNFNYVGIGCYYSSKTDTYYWAQLFTTTYPILSSQDFFMDLGETEAFAVTSSPTNNRFPILYDSSDPTVATIAEDGTVRALRTGTTELTAKYTDPSTDYPKKARGTTTATLTVTSFSPATRVSITQDSLVLNKGSAWQLFANLTPDNANPLVTWSSDRPAVAKVSSQGLVTAVGVGDATITVRAKSGVSAVCKVKVIQNATKVTVVPLAITLEKGASQQMSTQVLPLDHTEGERVEWSSSDPEVASVDEKGMLTTRAAGVAVITARVPSGKTGTAQVKVAVATTGLALEESPERMKKAQTYRLNTRLQPADATGAIAFTSNNTKVAKVVADGTVTAIAPGKATIVAKAENGISASCAVTVWCEPTSMTLGGTQTVNKGKKLRLTPTMKPADNGALLTWSTRMPEGIEGDPDAVATVTQDGELTAVGSGSVIVRVEAPEALNGVYAEKLIIVKAPATGISLKVMALNMHVEDEGTLAARMEPEDCTDKVTWSSSNKKVAKVDASGNVTAVGLGQAVITCKAQSGKSATCKVTVYADADGIEITNKTDILTVGKATGISYKLTPAGAYTPVTFNISNPDVTETAPGKVTASSAARNTSVTITATTINGASTSKTFQIKSPATAVTLDKTTLALHVNEGAGLSASLAPVGCTDSYTWSSSNKKVVTVDANGKVKAIGIGNANITCRTQSGKSATCKVAVYEDAESITITTKPTTLNVGKSLKLAYQLSPLKANTPVTFTSSNEKIATVDPTTGVVKAVSTEKGTSVTITATTLNGRATEITLQIKAPATKLTLEQITLKLEKGKEFTLKPPTLTPVVGCTDTWIWTSSNQKVATVNAAGKITGMGRGTVTITCKAQSGKSAACKVTVWEEPLTVQLTAAKKRINVGTSLKLATKQNPSNAAAPLLWTTNSSSIATVSEDGVVTCRAPGSFTVTAATPGGAQCSVTLESVQPATWLGAQQSKVSLPVGETYTLTYRLLPTNSNDSVTFVSNNTSVATVSTGGVITARKAGTAKITIKTGSGKSVICTVTVVKP